MPLRSNQYTSRKKSAGGSRLNLDEIQVGDTEFTLHLTQNSSFESVVSLDAVGTAVDIVCTSGLADDKA